MIVLYRWFTRGADPGSRAPFELVALRCLGAAVLTAMFVTTFTTSPRPGFSGRGPLVLAGMLALAACSVWAVGLANRPRDQWAPVRLTVLALVGVIVSADLLAAVQPNGFWSAGPYIVAIIAAGRLSLRAGAALLALSLSAPVVGSAIEGHGGAAVSLPLGTIPWFFVMRLMWELRRRGEALEASQAAEAQAAAAAERGRLAREMHDVLAHSLSALALQLESTRLLARARGVEEDVARAIDQAHHLAASGLDDARRAIAAARGDELPGPERIGALAEAFGEQSGLPISVDVRGEPLGLAPDARLALYRTAQEALTNVRRHAAADRVEVRLAYLPDATVLIVEDHAPAGTPPPLAVAGDRGGFGLTGMRERAELLGGELRAAPTGDGFRVELRLPRPGA